MSTSWRSLTLDRICLIIQTPQIVSRLSSNQLIVNRCVTRLTRTSCARHTEKLPADCRLFLCRSWPQNALSGRRVSCDPSHQFLNFFEKIFERRRPKMPFVGRDWRSPGEAWIKCISGWEQIKLRPFQLSSSVDSQPVSFEDRFKRHSSSVSLSSADEATLTSSASSASVGRSESDDSVYDEDEWIPHCFVKTTKSREFIGVTSFSEACHKLDIVRSVSNVRRFNYICKVVQILVDEKLQNLSSSARRHLFSIIQAMVIHSMENDMHINTARELVNNFGTRLEGHMYGSPQVVQQQMDIVSNLLDIVNSSRPQTLVDSSEESVTFMDLPKEVLGLILRRLPDHSTLLEAAKAHEVFDAIIEREERIWDSLSQFHFTQEQIEKHRTSTILGRTLFFQLKKYYGLREHYADLIHICCHCKALFWKDSGHPCVSPQAPSVRVTPRNFVDMLLFL
uniref:F-box domain-containing protein n=1 Tax=Panagrolaimus sp. JU765 TaxID=591449 RepID=A0AC34QCU4_9BILA